MNIEYLVQKQREAMAAVKEIERLTDWVNRSDFLLVIPRRDFDKKEDNRHEEMPSM